MEKNFLSVCVYVHNAERELGEFLMTIINIVESNFENSEIICINDYSDDDSLYKIKKISEKAKKTNITLLNMSFFHGIEAAMNAGIDLTIGDFVLEFDSIIMDFDKSLIMNTYYKVMEGIDIVSVSPDGKEKISSGFFYWLFNKFANTNYKFHTERFRIISRRVINRINNMNNTIPFRKVAYANCGLRSLDIKYKIQNKKKISHDKTEKKYRYSLATDTLLLFTEVGYRFSVTMTVGMMFIALFVAIYSVVIYFVSSPVEGWTTTILFLSVAFLGLFGILSIIIRYIKILVDLALKRKHYTFENIEKLNRSEGEGI